MRALLIDGGQSGCRAAVIDHGRTVATTTLGGLPRQGRDYAALRPLLAASGEPRPAVRGAADSLGWADAVAGGVDVVAAGLTGFAGEAAAVASALPAPTVLVTNDAVTAHLGALGGEPGVVIVAGTGAIALAVGEDEVARADGWGTRLGDDGGGYWIGRAGLAAALRAHDGRGGSPELLRRATTRLKGSDPSFGGDAEDLSGPAARGLTPPSAAAQIVAAAYDSADPVAVIAGFARDVADAARAGDVVAGEIFETAGRELARTALAAARRAGVDGPFSYAGGLFAAGELLLEPLRAELGALRPPLGDALDGAARLLERPPCFLDVIHETGAP